MKIHPTTSVTTLMIVHSSVATKAPVSKSQGRDCVKRKSIPHSKLLPWAKGTANGKLMTKFYISIDCTWRPEASVIANIVQRRHLQPAWLGFRSTNGSSTKIRGSRQQKSARAIHYTVRRFSLSLAMAKRLETQFQFSMSPEMSLWDWMHKNKCKPDSIHFLIL